jgi:2-dehydropantoate 2-reductase
MKLIINTMCLAPIALTGLSAAEGPKLPGMREMIFKIGTEALNVGQALGYRIQPIFGLTQDEVKDTNRLLETLFEKLLADIGPDARDCTLQDHLKGRKSEVEDINGLIVKKGKEVGAVTRCNSVIVEVTRRIQLGELSPSPSTFEIAKSMINNLDKSTN